MFMYKNIKTGAIEKSMLPLYDLNEDYKEYRGEEYEEKAIDGDVLVIRKALGDLLLLFPALELWKKIIGISDLTVASNDWLKPLIERQTFIDKFFDASEKNSRNYNLEINLEGVVDYVPISKRKHRTFMFADKLFDEWNTYQKSNYYYDESSIKIRDYFNLTLNDKNKGLELLNNNGWKDDCPLVLLAPFTKSILRNWGKELELIEATPEVCFVLTHNTKVEIYSKSKNIINLSGLTNIIELASIASLCKASVVPDSGTMHLSGVLNVPTLAIFGNVIPSRNRVSLYKNIIPIVSYCPFIEYCYDGQFYDCKSTLNYKMCMGNITVEMIKTKLITLLS